MPTCMRPIGNARFWDVMRPHATESGLRDRRSAAVKNRGRASCWKGITSVSLESELHTTPAMSCLNANIDRRPVPVDRRP